MNSFFSTFVLAVLAVTLASGASLGDNQPENARRSRRELSSVVSQLAGMFFDRGGQQGVNDLNNSDDKMGVLKRYLGSAIAGAVFGNGNDLVSSIMSSFGGGGSRSNSGNSNNGGSNSFSGSRSSSNPSSNNGGSVPVSTNSKTGVSVVDSRPGDRRPNSPSNSNADEGFGSSRRGSSARGSAAGQRDSDQEPQQPIANSKTGVSIINSRPGDRRPSSTNTGTASRGSAGDSNDYEFESSRGSNTDSRARADGDFSRYAGNRRGEEAVRSGGNRGRSSVPVPANESDY